MNSGRSPTGHPVNRLNLYLGVQIIIRDSTYVAKPRRLPTTVPRALILHRPIYRRCIVCIIKYLPPWACKLLVGHKADLPAYVVNDEALSLYVAGASGFRGWCLTVGNSDYGDYDVAARYALMERWSLSRRTRPLRFCRDPVVAFGRPDGPR